MSLFKIFLRLKSYITKNIINRFKVKNKTKYFCIGQNKTGTTSLEQAFKKLGFIIADQRKAERLYDKFFFENQFDEIIRYCQTAEVFQDVPFSYFKVLPFIDKAYPGSKFILTVRNSSEEWYRSITQFHAKKFGLNGRVPTYEDLENAEYVRRGFMARLVESHGTSSEDPYNKETMIAHYEKHNQDVLDYFKDRPEDLLVINVSELDSYEKFENFLGVKTGIKQFPWKNKT